MNNGVNGYGTATATAVIPTLVFVETFVLHRDG